MSRIIAGAAAGARLGSVPGTGTRPTTDRTKEALFSWLEARGWCEGTDVLDLFAGSGALGLEALSRGAASVVLVERDRRAAQVCRANAALVARAAGGRPARVLVQAVERFLASAEAESADLVLADPPYPLDGDELTAVLEAAAAALAPGGLLVLERSVSSAPPAAPGRLEPVESRTYGESALYFWQDPR